MCTLLSLTYNVEKTAYVTESRVYSPIFKNDLNALSKKIKYQYKSTSDMLCETYITSISHNQGKEVHKFQSHSQLQDALDLSLLKHVSLSRFD